MISCSLRLLCDQKEQTKMSPDGRSAWVEAYAWAVLEVQGGFETA